MTVTVPSRERGVYTLRLAEAERRLLEAAAASRQEYLAEFIRRTAIESAKRESRVDVNTQPHRVVDIPTSPGATLRVAMVHDGDAGEVLILAHGFGSGDDFRRPEWCGSPLRLPAASLPDLRRALVELEAVPSHPADVAGARSGRVSSAPEGFRPSARHVDPDGTRDYDASRAD
jgi:uncharacterized protein (DUF1778 family)